MFIFYDLAYMILVWYIYSDFKLSHNIKYQNFTLHSLRIYEEKDHF